MNPELPSFGADETEFFPPLSDGAEVMLKITSAPEKYESLYGEKIRLGIKTTGLNQHCPEEIELNKKYTISSSAVCYQSLHAAWSKGENEFWKKLCMKCEWKLSAKTLPNKKTIYKLEAQQLKI